MKVNFIDAGMIMSVVVALIILAVGVFAFFVTIQNIPTTSTEAEEVIREIADSGNSVFNIIGVVLVIGAIMSIVGLIYSYVAPISGYDNDDDNNIVDNYDDDFDDDFDDFDDDFDDDNIDDFDDDFVYSNLPQKKFAEPTKVKSKSKIKKKDSFEWGN